MGYLFNVLTLCLLLLSSLVQAQYQRPPHLLRHEGHRLPPLPRLSKTHNGYHQRGKNGSVCIQAPPAQIGAPKKNVWAALTYEEVVQVRQFLFDQKELNLAPGGYGYGYGYGNAPTLGKIELNAPNKTAVLPYLDANGPEPPRYAKTQLNSNYPGYTEVQEIFVGPLPVDETTTWQPLGYPYSRKDGHIVSGQKYPDYGYHSAYIFSKDLKDHAQDVFAGLWPQLNHTWQFYSSAQFAQGEGRYSLWYYSYTVSNTDDYGVGYQWPLGLYYGLELNEKDPENVDFLGWIYNETLYPNTNDLRTALRNGTIQPVKATIAGEWSRGGAHGRAMPMDIMPPPQAVAPAGSRFSLDKNAKYVEWMGFSFYMGFTNNRGWAFYDIRHKGQRILYELSLQEALAHYAGTDPAQSTTWYRDAAIGLGDAIIEMVPGYDCPTYARYWSTHSGYDNSKGYLTNNAICFFEFDADYPIARHSGGGYITSRKNIYFVVRSIYTVGNYDYMFSYEFYLDGSIKVVVRASGYIAGQSAIGNHEYGYDIHAGYSGGMHDHTLNFKADFDILGTANTMQLTTFVPANEKYLWSTEPRETLKLKREIVASEDDSRLNWNRATQYSVINTDRPNQWGEYRGYRIMPADGTTHFTNKKSSNAKNTIHPFTFDLGITKFKDTEPQSTNPNDEIDIENPMINFDDFFNGESLEQEDLVTWVNLGMHHLPHTGDLPFTLFTTAHASVHFQPLNYYYDDISTESLSQVQVDYKYGNNGTSEIVRTFGQNPAWCSIDLSKDAPDIYAAEGYSYGGYYK